jgi:hypothetical protein
VFKIPNRKVTKFIRIIDFICSLGWMFVCSCLTFRIGAVGTAGAGAAGRGGAAGQSQLRCGGAAGTPAGSQPPIPSTSAPHCCICCRILSVDTPLWLSASLRACLHNRRDCASSLLILYSGALVLVGDCCHHLCCARTLEALSQHSSVMMQTHTCAMCDVSAPECSAFVRQHRFTCAVARLFVRAFVFVWVSVGGVVANRGRT